MEIRYEPDFETWLNSFHNDEDLFDIYAEIVALIDHLGDVGQHIIEPESCPLTTSRYLHELRRTPPTNTTPYATSHPCYVSCTCFVKPLLVKRLRSSFTVATKPPPVTTGTPKTSCSPKPGSPVSLEPKNSHHCATNHQPNINHQKR